jgi:aquaporin Z
MNQRVLAAELIGTFMLMAAVLGAFYAFGAPPSPGAPPGGADLLGIALTVGFTAMALALAIGHVPREVSGAHLNPAVTLGLIAGGRLPAGSAVGYIAAQCVGAVAACGVYWLIGRAPPAFAANGYGALSPTQAGMLPVFLVETVLAAFLVFIIMGATNRRAPAGFAPVALGATLAAIHVMAIPISNASVNPARSLGSALFAGAAPLGQLWLFWVAPILGGVIGGALARWLQEE